MTAYADHGQFDLAQLTNRRVSGAEGAPEAMADLTMTRWGYMIGAGDRRERGIGLGLARFCGVILFLSGLVLGLLPDGGAGLGLIAMKLGAMVLFMVFGGVLVWAGRRRPGNELHVDLRERKLRLGGRDLSGNFRLADVLGFDDVTSVFLMRNAGETRAARLFLRLEGDVAIEIARGDCAAMDRLRHRLTYDLRNGLVLA